MKSKGVSGVNDCLSLSLVRSIARFVGLSAVRPVEVKGKVWNPVDKGGKF